MGSRYRRAFAPGDRLAGPPTAGPLRGSCGPPATKSRARAHGPGDRSLLLGDEDPVALEHVEGLRERAAGGRAVFGTIDSWLLFNLTGEHLTDASNASRTMLLGHRRRRWDAELMELLDVPGARWRALRERRGPRADQPERCTATRSPSRASPATSRRRCSARAASIRGWARTRTAPARSCWSTPAFARPSRARAAERPSPRRSVGRSVCAGGVDLRDRRGGAVAARRAWHHRSRRGDRGARGGAAGQRRRVLRARADRAGLSALGPRGARHDRRPDARGRARPARPRDLEAIAYQTVDAVRAIEAAGEQRLGELRADGGATANGWLMQFQADVLGVPVVLEGSPDDGSRGGAACGHRSRRVDGLRRAQRLACRRALRAADECGRA